MNRVFVVQKMRCSPTLKTHTWVSGGSAEIDGLKGVCGLTGESGVIAGVALHLVAVETHYN